MTRTFIQDCLNGLKSLLDRHNQMKMYGAEGILLDVVCTFNRPATKEEIETFEKEASFSLPDDYRAFLQIHNGASIFDVLLNGSMNIGGGLYLFSIEEVIRTKNELAFKENHFPIGRLLEGCHLVIDIENIKGHDSNYLVIVNPFFNEYQDLKLNFELFINRYLLSQGSTFWEWPICTAENYYRTHYVDD